MTVTTYGTGANAVAIEHEEDWSGDALLAWREGDRYRKAVIPARIVRAITESVRAEVLLTMTSEMLDAASDKLADTADAVDRLSTDVERASLRPPPIK